EPTNRAGCAASEPDWSAGCQPVGLKPPGGVGSHQGLFRVPRRQPMLRRRGDLSRLASGGGGSPPLVPHQSSCSPYLLCGRLSPREDAKRPAPSSPPCRLRPWNAVSKNRRFTGSTDDRERPQLRR